MLCLLRIALRIALGAHYAFIARCAALSVELRFVFVARCIALRVALRVALHCALRCVLRCWLRCVVSLCDLCDM